MYEMKIRVRYSETDKDGIVRLHQILEYFQDCGIFQSEMLGMGVKEDRKAHRAWYLLAWDVKIKRHPRMSEYITVTTQAYKMRGFYGYRRYSIIDESGEKIVTAESIWILMDTKKMLPMKVPEEVTEKYVDKKADSKVRIKRKISCGSEWEEREAIEITRLYLDTNNHVNNTFYALWAEEQLPEDVRAGEIRIDYRKAAVLKDTIHVFVQKEFVPNESKGEICERSDRHEEDNEENNRDTVYRVKFLNQEEEIAALAEIRALR